jgi:hypothetical protein
MIFAIVGFSLGTLGLITLLQLGNYWKYERDPLHGKTLFPISKANEISEDDSEFEEWKRENVISIELEKGYSMCGHDNDRLPDHLVKAHYEVKHLETQITN